MDYICQSSIPKICEFAFNKEQITALQLPSRLELQHSSEIVTGTSSTPYVVRSNKYYNTQYNSHMTLPDTNIKSSKYGPLWIWSGNSSISTPQTRSYMIQLQNVESLFQGFCQQAYQVYEHCMLHSSSDIIAIDTTSRRLISTNYTTACLYAAVSWVSGIWI